MPAKKKENDLPYQSWSVKSIRQMQLATDLFTDILVSHIMGLNIKIPKLALENNITNFKEREF